MMKLEEVIEMQWYKIHILCGSYAPLNTTCDLQI